MRQFKTEVLQALETTTTGRWEKAFSYAPPSRVESSRVESHVIIRNNKCLIFIFIFFIFYLCARPAVGLLSRLQSRRASMEKKSSGSSSSSLSLRYLLTRSLKVNTYAEGGEGEVGKENQLDMPGALYNKEEEEEEEEDEKKGGNLCWAESSFVMN